MNGTRNWFSVLRKEKLPCKRKKNIHVANKKLSLKEQANFFAVLSSMLQAGFSLQKSLNNISILGQKNTKQIQKMQQDLNSGRTFSQTIRPWVSQTVYFQIKISEQHGNLDLSIQELGNFLYDASEQVQKLRGLLLYPFILLFLLAGMCISIKIWLMPQLKAFSTSVDPASSQKMTFDLGQFFKLLGMIVLVVLVVYLLRVFSWWLKQGSLTRHVWYAQLPILGKIYRLYSAYLTSFELSLLFRCGLDIQEICSYLQEFEESSLYYQLGYELECFLNEGQELNTFIRRYSFIPHELLLFLNNGDSQVEMSEELAVFSKSSYHNLLRESERLLTWIQPILFLIIAAVIIGTYLAILLPIYSSIGGIYK